VTLSGAVLASETATWESLCFYGAQTSVMPILEAQSVFRFEQHAQALIASKGGFAIIKAASISPVGLVYTIAVEGFVRMIWCPKQKVPYSSIFAIHDKTKYTLNALVCEVQVNAVWHNMREEPVIYINGRPFVLREDERPFKNMQEYTGIDVQRLEQMELRLKNDILQVACSFKAHWALISHSESNSEHLSRSESIDDKLSVSSMIECWYVSSLSAA